MLRDANGGPDLKVAKESKVSKITGRKQTKNGASAQRTEVSLFLFADRAGMDQAIIGAMTHMNVRISHFSLHYLIYLSNVLEWLNQYLLMNHPWFTLKKLMICPIIWVVD